MFHAESLVVISLVKTRQKIKKKTQVLGRLGKQENRDVTYGVNPDGNFDLQKIVVCRALTQPWCRTFFAPLCRWNNITLNHLLKPFDTKMDIFTMQVRYTLLRFLPDAPCHTVKNAGDPVKFLSGGNNTKYKEPLPVWFLIHFLKNPVCEHQSPL